MSIFVSQKPLDTWLSEYATSHQNPTNKAIHWLCVPIIFLCIVALLYAIHPWLCFGVAAGVLWFYLRLSLGLFVLMTVFVALCLAAAHYLPVAIWFWLAVFVVAWIGQFIGHKIEGAKPSFFEDLQFLLIGPAWVACDIWRKISR
ncbi:Mpo1 family 2-hydroxy fatty acid dioxygenase [Moraxella marmotae]|uniref:Mpo1 family 2-hydroxy fatty acid dioxygenase n=1 Tax=Moraxella marmotae TaxID=3344520 RepID=UPI0035F25F01